ncbi:MAG: response regulator transcription factor [Ndongobacter sp.]|nr:response regulator transcription factor [Ndongobacter sp.]
MRVLFLEDEAVIREVLTEYMEMAGYTVCPAPDGDEAMRLLEEHLFDIAVLDILVPGPSGMEVLKKIRETEKLHNLGVIMLTALEDVQSQVSAFNQLADDYIVKPASPIILLKRMETILRRIQPEMGSVGGLQILEEAYVATYDGEALPLTISEFLILKTLKSHPKRVFTRGQLIMQVFNEDYIGNDRVIDAHIKNLRKKLPKPFIRTVIGVGYQFDESVDV